MRKKALIALAVLFVVAQLVPSTAPQNPAVNAAHRIESSAHKLPPAVAATLARSCRDCHSSETVWPWYSHVAPVSWLIAHDVKEGRRELNLSQWGSFPPRRVDHKLEEICEQVEHGTMPPWYYVTMHPRARLSPVDGKAICAWTGAERAAIPATAH